ncbi:hypothetical protein MML48_1g02276 [Holotrichia oblita]|uniref:Uncharacterized protein n=1 Tax=Holotrichia oblita TaxID=644536 RepID=A0ACB9TXD4_HOLOL|nr:hypothetical protein MML48_1g02276 [Holotrichia oblita]
MSIKRFFSRNSYKIKYQRLKDIPPVPIKTYKWEDIRREKRKGRYPYTYLSKEPYNEDIDPNQFKMDTLKPSKSASTLEKSGSGVNIQDITDKSVNNGKDYLEVHEGIVDAPDSSNEDNVSQYLDKDDDPPVIVEHLEIPGPSKVEEKMDVDDDKQGERAKSEEPKRKRKLSIESSYSRISLSKLGVMKKLREAKEKLKLPKFSFSKSESKLDIPKQSKERERKKSNSREAAKKTLQAYLEPKKDNAPVYIHIPLKPPPGETDEFSYLEFEEKKPDAPSAPTINVDKQDAEKTTDAEPTDEPGVQFIILTAPSDDETLNNPDTPSTGTTKKFLENVTLKDLQSLPQECIDKISPDMPIDGIIFEDVVQVKYFDEYNRPIGTTETSKIHEVTEGNLPKLEKKLSQRNLAKELEKEIASSMDSLQKIARQNTLKKLKEDHKSRSSEALRKLDNGKQRTTQEAPELTSVSKASADELPKASKVERAKSEKIKRSKPEKSGEPKPGKSDESKTDNAKLQIAKEEKKEIPKSSSEEPQAADKKVMYDEEDGLKLSEAAVKMINEELAKEQLPKTDEEQLKAAAKTDPAKKKVSFKRRSKQEDPHGVYEDVQVTSDSKKVDGKEQQTKELKVIEPSQSMSVDEEKSYLDDKIMKMTSLEEDYNKWSKITDHEYEPVNPPAENGIQQHAPPPPPPEVQITDAPVKRTSSKKSPPNSIRIPLTDEVVVQSDEEHESGDALTVEEMQARIEDQFFNQSTPSTQLADSSTNKTPASSTASNKENASQPSQAKKFQDTLKIQTGKLRAKFQNIKAPKINMPQRPNFEKLKIQKPNITLPKIPDQMRVNLPSFTLPKKNSARKRPVKQFSTESNVGDSKKKLFDFSTYPRIFKKKKKPDDLNDDDIGMSATVPRSKKSPKGRRNHSKGAKETEKKRKSPDVIRIPLHSEESMDKEEYNLASRARYEDENIDMDDAYVRESQQMNTASALNAGDFGRSRWNHGSFHGHNLNEIENRDNEPEPPALTSFQNETKTSELSSFENEPKSSELDSFENEPRDAMLDQEMERPQTSPEPEFEQEMDSRQSDMRSVSSSGDVHRPGVLEKINSNEYFIQIGGNYASSELREAFRQPTNQLAKLQTDDSFDREFDISDQSIQEIPKRRPIRKPKRKKTPNVSRERIPYDQESEPEEYPEPYIEQPARPKRKSKQKKNPDDDKPPYQETIFVPEQEFEVMRKSASENILLTDRGVEDNFHNGHFRQEYPQLYENERMQGIEQPNILICSPYYKQAFRYQDDHNIPLQRYGNETPEAPPRKRSLKSLVSEHDSIIDEINLPEHETSQPNIDMNKLEHEYIIPTPDIPPVRPARTRSRTRSHSRATSQPEDEQQQQLPEPQQPCVEEPCVQQVCDYMGYAVIEKNRHREPPLPPPTRKKRAAAKTDAKFFTVPRPLKEEAPIRPIRNYSTLVPKGSRSPTSFGKDEKENLDLGQYIEIEDDDEHSRLQSGEIVQKMKDRPLPAPPRPPRKTKDSDKDGPFKDITNQNDLDEEEPPLKTKLEEAEVSVQTEPLPDDVVCEELVQEKGDKIIIPTTSKYHQPITEFENIETVTHGALVVTPVPEDFQEGPITSFSRSTERIITIRREVDNEKDSKIPGSYTYTKESQPTIIERIIERPIASSPEIEVLKAQKLQVSDLDVDRLMVNELLASKIKVSEIDSDSISVTEINPKSGNLVIGGLELPASLIQEILNKLKSSQSSPESQSSTPQQTPESQTKVSKIEKQIGTSKNEEDSTENENDLEEFSKLTVKEDVPLRDDKSFVKFDEPILSLEEEFPSETEEKLSQPDSELSPTTLKTTIEYLDDLLMEENKRQEIEESARKIVQDVLQAAVDAKTALPTLGRQQEYPFFEKSESIDLEEVPPLVPDTSEEERLIQELKTDSAGQKKTPIEKQLDEPPKRPPRQSDIHRLQQSQEDIFIPSQIIENSHNILLNDTPPPRPPDPEERLYLRSQPPPSFYVLRSPALDDLVDEDIPLPPRRKRPPRPPSRSTSEEEAPPATPRSRRHRTPEPSIPQLTGQLTRACATASQKAFKRLVKHVTMNILRNADAGLILLGNGGSPIVHHHHWEYFNPPRDL